MEGLLMFSEPNYRKYRDFSPTELFGLFFDDEMFELNVKQSTIYCNYKNLPAVSVTKDEIKTFFGILLVSGYCPLHSKA